MGRQRTSTANKNDLPHKDKTSGSAMTACVRFRAPNHHQVDSPC